MMARASAERRPVYPIILYVETRTHASLCSGSLEPAMKRVTRSLSICAHMRNCWYHCSTETDELHSTSVLRLTVHAATMPTRVLPAPQGSTMMPERARWLPKQRLSACS